MRHLVYKVGYSVMQIHSSPFAITLLYLEKHNLIDTTTNQQFIDFMTR